MSSDMDVDENFGTMPIHLYNSPGTNGSKNRFSPQKSIIDMKSDNFRISIPDEPEEDDEPWVMPSPHLPEPSWTLNFP